MTALIRLGNVPRMEPAWKRELRAAVGRGEGKVSMKALSLAAGLNETFVRDVLQRDKDPSTTTFIALASAMGKSPGAWLEGEAAHETPLRPAPLLNWVSAGRLSETATVPPSERVFYVPDLGPGDYFALEVKGTSMNRISPEGSVIIVNRRETALQRGKPYIFSVRGEATFKVWEPEPARLEPDSTDPSNKPIFIKDKSRLTVVGRVRRTILDL